MYLSGAGEQEWGKRNNENWRVEQHPVEMERSRGHDGVKRGKQVSTIKRRERKFGPENDWEKDPIRNLRKA